MVGQANTQEDESEELIRDNKVLSKVAKRNAAKGSVLFSAKEAMIKNGLPQEHIFVALLQYMELVDERKVIVRMGYSGKNPECVAWSSKPRYLMLVKPWQEGADNPAILTRSMHAKMLRKQTLRGRQAHLGVEPEGDPADEQQQLQQLAESLGINTQQKSADEGDLGYDLFKACVTNLFKLYARKAASENEDENSFPREDKALVLDIRSWMRMCHRMQIFDNEFGYVEAYKLFRNVCQDPESAGYGRARELELQDFKSLMGKLGKELFNSDSSEGARESRSKLTARVLIPYLTKEDARRFKHQITGYSLSHPTESLMSWETMTVFEQVDEQLKTVFAHYATLEELNMNAMTWAAVRQKGSILNSDSFILFLLNFSVAPYLVSKNSALDMMATAKTEAAELGMEFELNYPTFVECLGRITILINEAKRERLASPDLTVPEFRALKQLLGFTPAQVRSAVKDELEARGRWFEVEGLHRVPPPKSEDDYDQDRLKGIAKCQEINDRLEELRARACLVARDEALHRLEMRKARRCDLDAKAWGSCAPTEGFLGTSWNSSGQLVASGAVGGGGSPGARDKDGTDKGSGAEPGPASQGPAHGFSVERLPHLSTSYSAVSAAPRVAPYSTSRSPSKGAASDGPRSSAGEATELDEFEARLPSLLAGFTREREMGGWKTIRKGSPARGPPHGHHAGR